MSEDVAPLSDGSSPGGAEDGLGRREGDLVALSVVLEGSNSVKMRLPRLRTLRASAAAEARWTRGG